MNLFLLRHGLAVEFGTPGYTEDAERPLTAKGERKISQVGEAMAALGLEFDILLSSPYVRARQTAEIVAAALGIRKQLQCSPALAPGAGSREAIDCLTRLKPAPENVLVVGHEPNLSQLIALLVSGGLGLSVTMKKGALCKLAIDSIRHGRCASLEWLLTPKQMALMGVKA